MYNDRLIAAPSQRAFDELEARVNERTAELAEANALLRKEVAERRLAEEAARTGEDRVLQLAGDLANERQRFADILNSVPAVVFEHWSLEEARRNFVSNYVETMNGYSPQEWLSTPDFWSRTIHPDDRERVLEIAARAFAAGTFDGMKDQFRWITKDNRVVWGETHRIAIRDPVSGAAGVRGFTVDITERKQAEEKLKQLHEKLVEASREAGKAEVATNVLHNVGNVLNSVNVSATLATDHVRQSSAPHLDRAAALLRENAEDLGAYLTADPVGRKLPGFLGQLAGQIEAEQAAVLARVETTRQNMSSTSRTSSPCSRATRAPPASARRSRSSDLIEDSLRMNAGALLRHDVELIREFEVRPVIRVDKHKVMQILINLIRNAKYACDESRRADKRLTMRIAGDDGIVRVSVIDNGVRHCAGKHDAHLFPRVHHPRRRARLWPAQQRARGARDWAARSASRATGRAAAPVFTLELPFTAPPL